VFGEELRRRALVLLAEIGVPVKYGHSEVGYIEPGDGDERIWEQHEVELALQPLPDASDAVVLAQWLLRNLAHERGFRCRFDPILRQGHAGSGLHVHLAPRVAGTFRSVAGPSGALATEAAWLVAGLVTSAPALMAFGNRVPSSFVRLQQAKEAPSRVSWGRYNRKALVRIPIVARDDQGRAVGPETVEFRLPDGSAHPHLLLAGIAQSMLAGRGVVSDDLLARTAVGESDEASPPVPRSFAEVAEGLRQRRGVLEAGGVFPPHVIDRFLQVLDPNA